MGLRGTKVGKIMLSGEAGTNQTATQRPRENKRRNGGLGGGAARKENDWEQSNRKTRGTHDPHDIQKADGGRAVGDFRNKGGVSLKSPEGRAVVTSDGIQE